MNSISWRGGTGQMWGGRREAQAR